MKDLFKYLKNDKGYSLIEIVVAMGLMGVVGLGVASLSGVMNTEQRGAEGMASRTEFASAMAIHLYSPKGCDAIKTNAFSTTEQQFRVTNMTYDGVTVFEKDTKLKSFMISDMTARLEDMTGLPTVRMTLADGSEQDLKKTLVVVTTSIKYKDKVYKHVYNVPVLASPTNTVEFCGDDRTMAETCAALQGKYDPVSKDCELRQSCSSHGSFVTLTCNPVLAGGCDTSRGTNQGNPAAGGIQGCPNGTTSVSTGADTWSTQRSCGKKCTADINHTLGYYSCIKCSDI